MNPRRCPNCLADLTETNWKARCGDCGRRGCSICIDRRSGFCESCLGDETADDGAAGKSRRSTPTIAELDALAAFGMCLPPISGGSPEDDKPACTEHEWMANPDLLNFDRDLEGIPPYVCRNCPAVGDDYDGPQGDWILEREATAPTHANHDDPENVALDALIAACHVLPTDDPFFTADPDRETYAKPEDDEPDTLLADLGNVVEVLVVCEGNVDQEINAVINARDEIIRLRAENATYRAIREDEHALEIEAMDAFHDTPEAQRAGDLAVEYASGLMAAQDDAVKLRAEVERLTAEVATLKEERKHLYCADEI